VRSLILVLAVLGGGGHGGGGGFHGRDRFYRFYRLGFFGDFGFVGPVVGFGFGPFFWDPFWLPAPYPAYPLRSTACDPAGDQRVRAAGGLTRDNVLVLLCREQWVLPIHTAVPQPAGDRSRRPQRANGTDERRNPISISVRPEGRVTPGG
jgi:hypothetical protein